MKRQIRGWLLGLGLLGLLLLAAVLLVIWVAGQVAGVLADHWPPVSYPLGALGELGAILTHPRSGIAPQVPATGFWLYLAGELGLVITGAVKVVRRGSRARCERWTAPTVLQGGARHPGDGFLRAYDQISQRDSQR